MESGVKYLKINFLPGRVFYDDLHLAEALAEWTATIADQRVHGTTHERPIDRFARERAFLVPTATQPSFRLETRQLRVVANDFLVSLDTNRFIGKPAPPGGNRPLVCTAPSGRALNEQTQSLGLPP